MKCTKRKKLTARFFARPTLTVARNLLGKYLIVRHGRKVLAGKIVETEAYIGESDLACHASKGRTRRTETLYAPPGTLYVYLIYGMYHCLNVVTEKKDFPSAVLIRAVEPTEGIAAMQKARKTHKLHRIASGPGKLCQAFGIGRQHNGREASLKSGLWFEDRGERIPEKGIARAKRIGVEYARHCADYLWRFYLNKNDHTSH